MTHHNVETQSAEREIVRLANRVVKTCEDIQTGAISAPHVAWARVAMSRDAQEAQRIAETTRSLT